MSGIEVVAAVSAVVSAFHGGSELVKIIKKKRRARKARSQSQQDYEEDQLETSLVTGEQQINLRYTQDMRELGDLMRVGDVLARDRLFHIAIVLQAEVIKNLQVAAEHDHALLNLRLLQQAAIMNRDDTFVTLDQLKQRMLLQRPVARQLEYAPKTAMSPQSTGTARTVSTDNYAPSSKNLLSDISSAAAYSQYGSNQMSTHGLLQHFHEESNSHPPQKPSAQLMDVNFSSALEHLVRSRATEDRAVILKDIDEMIISYQKLHTSNQPSQGYANNQYQSGYTDGRHEYPAPPHQAPFSPDQVGRNLAPAPLYHNLPPTPEEYSNQQGYPPFNQEVFNQQQVPLFLDNQYVARNPYPQMQMQASSPRWSGASASSSAYSDATSSERHSSHSSQGSNVQSTSLGPDSSPRQIRHSSLAQGHQSIPYPRQDATNQVPHPSSGSYAAPQDSYAYPIAPQASSSYQNFQQPPMQQPSSSPPHVPWPGSKDTQDAPISAPYRNPQQPPQHYPEPRNDEPLSSHKPSRSKYKIPFMKRDSQSSHSSQSDRTITKALANSATLGTAPATAGLRQASIAASIASTSSSNSGSLSINPLPRTTSNTSSAHTTRTTPIRLSSIASPPAGPSTDKMLSGRPCKANNYWGFCKGAWAVREDQSKGLALRTMPTGMYATKQVWECTGCAFQGETFSASHASKKNKTVTVVDPRAHISASGIRYRWIFLVKSHVKKKVAEGSAEDAMFGCVVCNAENLVSSVYGGVETLMNHIVLAHGGMNAEIARKVGCIVGRTAGGNEAWDFNLPVAGTVEELA